jgi:hypothetical protein
VDSGAAITTRAQLGQAYRDSHYRVEAAGAPLVLRVGKSSPPLDALLRASGVRTAALLTAANPRSRLLGARDNRQRHTRLLSRLAGCPCRWLPTVAQDPRGLWPDERGVLALGLLRHQAVAIALEFDQNAFLWCEAGRAPRLCWAGGETSGAAARLDQHRGDYGGKA